MTVKAPQPEQGSVQTRGFVSPRTFHTGGVPAAAAADFNNSTPVSTELYLAEIYVAAPCIVRGAAVFNGSDVTDNIKAALFDAEGVMLAASISTAGAGPDAYQLVPFTLDYTGAGAITQILLQRGTYYIGTCYASNTSRFNTHVVGAFGAGKITSLVFATNFVTTGLTVATPKTFTTVLGPVATLY